MQKVCSLNSVAYSDVANSDVANSDVANSDVANSDGGVEVQIKIYINFAAVAIAFF